MKLTSSSESISVFDAETITNIYLWGEKNIPTELYERVKSSSYMESLPTVTIDQQQISVVKLTIDGSDMMSNGAGRFAKLSEFELVADFFETDTLPPGVYTYSQIISELNSVQIINKSYSDSLSIRHSNRSDANDLTAERSYIFQNSSYLFGQRPQDQTDLRFVINADGSKEILNAEIRPFDDNFDFVGGDIFADIFNSLSTTDVDPYGNGVRIEFDYDNSSIATFTYSETDYQSDLQFVSDTSSLLPNPEGKDVVDAEIEAAANYQVDEFSIYVGSHEADAIDAEDAAGNGMISDIPVLVLAGEGEDTVNGDSKDDRIYGHEQNDNLYGGGGADVIVGGSGDDLVEGEDGSDFLFGDSSGENYHGAEEPNVVFGDDTVLGGKGDDFIVGGGGADILRGGEGDDTIYFDADDTEVNGGAGRDVGVYEGSTGLTISLDDHWELDNSELEVVVGGSGADNFYIGSSGGMVAGGGGDDIITSWGNTGNGPSVVWGGEGADTFHTFGKILVAEVDGLTEDNFADFSLDMLGLGGSFNWSAIDTVILNPDAEDTVTRFGGSLGSGTIDIRQSSISFDGFETIDGGGTVGDSNMTSFGFRSLLLDVTAAGGLSAPYSIGSGQPRPIGQDVYAAGYFDASFLGGGISTIQTSIRFGARSEIFRYDSDGNLSGTEDYDLSSAVASGSVTLLNGGGVDFTEDSGEIYFWMDYSGYETLNLHPGFGDGNIPSWFVAGGHFVGEQLIANGSVTATMPSGSDHAEPIEDHTELNFDPGSGNRSFSGFQPAINAIVIAGAVVDPNASQTGIALSQQGADTVITIGQNETITLVDTSLSDWQATATSQLSGTAASETLTGTSTDELIAGAAGDDVLNGGGGDDLLFGGSGNDTILAGHGDDTIVYSSGDDLIHGYQSNIGDDTLDLSKYSSDQVTFSNNGHHVLIQTPDGQITLRDQHRYDVGHNNTNIETILFSDGTLDEIAIRTRSHQDQGTDGDDTVTGTQFADEIVSGSGNDTILAGHGDDTIVYSSGDDLIHGYQSNIGDDTLDLSKYSSDQVTFSNNGHHVLIQTPDGQITLRDQHRYDVGHNNTNIETILFSDGTLDEIAIRTRSHQDQGTDGDDTVTGTQFADEIVSGSGNDTILAGHGDDTIVYSSGDDLIHGYQSNIGDDTLDLSKYSSDQVTFSNNGHHVLIQTPDGQITLRDQHRYDVGHNNTNIETILFSDGTLDEIAIRTRSHQDQGTDGDDTVTGTQFADEIVSGSGNDTILAGHGDDTIVYSSGDDLIHGYQSNIGDDTLDLSKYSSDQVTFSNNGHHVLIQTPDGQITLRDQHRYDVGHNNTNIETILFSDGTLDEIAIRTRSHQDQGTDGDDTVTGTQFADEIVSGSGNDTILAGHGDDTIVYSSGDDEIHGYQSNIGNDTLDLSKYSSDQVTFSNNGHHVLIQTPDGQITLRDQHRYDVGHNNTNIETILFSDGTLDEIAIRTRSHQDQGTDGDDTVTGTQFADEIVSGSGNDTILAGHGDDTIVYSSGDDEIHGYQSNIGNDTLDLSKYSSDQVTFSNNGHHVLIQTPDGQITLRDQHRYDVGHNNTNIETILFSDGTLDEIAIRTRSHQDQGTDGDDTVTGTQFADEIVSGSGNDTILAGHGDDTIVYSSGDDEIHGYQSNIGNDTLDLSKYSSDQVTFSNNGHHVLIQTPDGQITLRDQHRYDVGHNNTNIETILFSDGTLDEIAIRTRSHQDQGTDGDDTVTGTQFADMIDAGSGNDVIAGGAGADTFVFRENFGEDTVSDFSDGTDLIQIDIAGLSFSNLGISDANGDVELSVAGHGTLTLENVSSLVLTEEDFMFV